MTPIDFVFARFFCQSGLDRIGWFVRRPGNIPDDVRRPVLRLQFLKSRLFQTHTLLSIERAEAIEKQLTDIGQRDSVATRDALQGDLLHQSSEEAIDRSGVAEVANTRKKLGRGGFASALSLQVALSMMGAEVCVDAHDQHAAAMATPVNMAAKSGFGICF